MGQGLTFDDIGEIIAGNTKITPGLSPKKGVRWLGVDNDAVEVKESCCNQSVLVETAKLRQKYQTG